MLLTIEYRYEGFVWVLMKSLKNIDNILFDSHSKFIFKIQRKEKQNENITKDMQTERWK
jgi:hypothetical protein